MTHTRILLENDMQNLIERLLEYVFENKVPGKKFQKSGNGKLSGLL